jgi:hypothetical protein
LVESALVQQEIGTMSHGEGSGSRWKRQCEWALVFALNSILPLLLVVSGVAADGFGNYAGVITALLILWASGATAVAASRALRFALLSGGVLTGLALGMTWIPPLGLNLWMLTLQAAERIVPLGREGLPTYMEGFLLTFVTGGLIAVTALAVGMVFYGLWRLRK